MNTNQHSNPAKRFFIIGFMGTGKSNWGKQWAALHNMSFLDLDELIEKAEEKSVVDIFEKAGEDYFRVKETSILRDQCLQQNTIISCGGGTPCFNDNMAWMNEHGFTIYLSASAPYIFKKCAGRKREKASCKKCK